jgi:Pyridoxamine 5'-phosphate oxidase
VSVESDRVEVRPKVERQPITVTNLDRYENPVLPWDRPHHLLESGPKGPLAGFFLGTVGKDGRPHVAGVGVVWYDGDLYFTSGPNTRKARNLAFESSCTLAVKFPDMDVTLEGEAQRITDHETLQRVVTIYQDLGWPAEVAEDAFTAPFSAPSAGPPPWHLYRFTFESVVGLSTTEPHGATRWTFAR